MDPLTRDAFRTFIEIPTRWGDNDVYGHVNNVVYYSFFDTAVNRHLIDEGGLDIHGSPCIGLVVETRCAFHEALEYPETLSVGLRVSRLGRSSVTYAIGLFRESGTEAAATGHFVHVWVDRQSRRPVPIPDRIRAALEPLLVGPEEA